MGALNSNMMSYSGQGTRNNQYAIWDRNVLLPMSGKVVTSIEKEVDNDPDIVAAIDLGDNTSGRDVELEEKPQNLVEIKPSIGKDSPFLLRLIHLRQNSIPSNIKVILIFCKVYNNTNSNFIVRPISIFLLYSIKLIFSSR